MDQDTDHAQTRTLRAMGITMLGVVLSVCVSVGFGAPGPWWLRVAAAVMTGVLLIAVVKATTEQGSKGTVAHLADWMIGTESSRDDETANDPPA